MNEDTKKKGRMKDKYSIDLRVVDLHTNSCLMQRKNSPATGTIKALLELIDAKD